MSFISSCMYIFVYNYYLSIFGNTFPNKKIYNNDITKHNQPDATVINVN